ncbi:MAG: response regulator transcription factor [Burkholderiales bacterium]|nr:response regulator transcription factor [Burkholderiales bacterium]
MAAERPARILIVDDDAEVRVLLRRVLVRDGFVVVEAQDAAEARHWFNQQVPDLVTLDLRLGADDGLTLAREFRASSKVPIIMITGVGDTIDRVVGLELGADDYIVKPFEGREVLARVRAVLRRYDGTAKVPPEPAPSKDERYAFGNWVLEPARRALVSRAGVEQSLTTLEFNLLELLVQRPGRILSRDNIMDLLKGHDWSPTDRTIDQLVVRVRRKIEPDPEAPQLIKTVRGTGYFFAASVTLV